MNEILADRVECSARVRIYRLSAPCHSYHTRGLYPLKSHPQITQRRQIIPYNVLCQYYHTAPVCTVGKRVLPRQRPEPRRIEHVATFDRTHYGLCGIRNKSNHGSPRRELPAFHSQKLSLLPYTFSCGDFASHHNENWRRKIGEIIPHTSKGFYLAPLQHAEQFVIRYPRSIATSHVRPERPLPPPSRRPASRVRGRESPAAALEQREHARHNVRRSISDQIPRDLYFLGSLWNKK